MEERKNISVVLHKLGMILKQNLEKQDENPIPNRFVSQIKIKKAIVRSKNFIFYTV